MIPDIARDNFIIKDTDDKQTILNKRFQLENDRLHRQYLAERKLEEINELLRDFEIKYNELKKLKKDKTTKGQLELQLALEELFD